jgi:hypothetical protein
MEERAFTVDVIERLERIEKLLAGHHVRPTPPELSRKEAARYLGVSIETLEKFQKAGLIRYRNASPEGSGKPRFRYPIADLDQFMQKGYRRDLPGPAKKPTPRRKPERQSYPHLDLD